MSPNQPPPRHLTRYVLAGLIAVAAVALLLVVASPGSATHPTTYQCEYGRVVGGVMTHDPTGGATDCPSYPFDTMTVGETVSFHNNDGVEHSLTVRGLPGPVTPVFQDLCVDEFTRGHDDPATTGEEWAKDGGSFVWTPTAGQYLVTWGAGCGPLAAAPSHSFLVCVADPLATGACAAVDITFPDRYCIPLGNGVTIPGMETFVSMCAGEPPWDPACQGTWLNRANGTQHYVILCKEDGELDRLCWGKRNSTSPSGGSGYEKCTRIPPDDNDCIPIWTEAYDFKTVNGVASRYNRNLVYIAASPGC